MEEKKYKEEKVFISGKFFEYQPGRLTIWIPKEQLVKCTTEKGDIAFNCAKLREQKGKNTHYAYVKPYKKAIPDFQEPLKTVEEKPWNVAVPASGEASGEFEGESVIPW